MRFRVSEGPMQMIAPGGWRYVSCALVLILALGSAGCTIAHQGSGGGSQSTTVAVTSAASSVGTGSTDNFTATVTGPNDTAVTWSVNGQQNGNSTVGMIGPGTCGTTLCAVYTAPATVPAGGTVSVTAVSVANGTTSSPVTLTITASNIKVSLTTPASSTVDAGATANFTATVTGTNNVGVNWLVNGNPNGNSTVGTITATSTTTGSTAVYTAPASPPSQAQMITITAQSQADTLASASSSVTLAPIVVTITPGSGFSIPVTGTQQFTASVTGTSNTAVTDWQVNGVSGGNSNIGTISTSGLYTAPTPPVTLTASPTQVTISVASAAATSVTGSVLGNVHVTVSVTPGTDTIGQGANLLYTATVNGAPSTAQGVNWTVPTQNGGGFLQVQDTIGIPSNQGIYIAPTLSAVATLSATILATSQFDPTQSGTATATVVESDPKGSVSNVQALPSSECPTFTGETATPQCYSLTVSCDQVADWTTYLKVDAPSGTPAGTVIFGTDGGGTGLYDTEYTNGGTIINGVVAKGYTTAQVAFAPLDNSEPNSNGWLTGPGGVRRLACRYATVASWIMNNQSTLNPNATAKTPVCATGNAAGADAIAYATAEYGINGVTTAGVTNPSFAMIELTSGPTMTALNQGCVCSLNALDPVNAPCNSDQGHGTTYQAQMCYTSGQTTIDAAYSQPTVCSSGNTINTLLLQSDSVFYQQGQGAGIPLPSTNLQQRFGANDTSADEPQGWAWATDVTKNVVPPPAKCESTASSDLPDDSQSATDIISDITNLCTATPHAATGVRQRKATRSLLPGIDSLEK